MRCSCGNEMMFKLRPVIYSKKVEIRNVPIYSCDQCMRSEVFVGIKPDLTELIRQLGSKPENQVILFDEFNEFAQLLTKMEDKEWLHLSVTGIIDERINQLLDLLLLAQSLEDDAWIQDIRTRLTEIAKYKVPV